MSNTSDKKITFSKVVVITFCILVLLSILKPFFFSFNDTKYIVTITDKERIHSGNEKYLVFGEDLDGNVVVFENSDSLLRGKWDSSNLQGELKIGNTYEITVVGYRVPLFSWYENIISAKEIT